MTRVEQARALAMQARSQFIPSVTYNGTVRRGRNYVFGSGFPHNSTTVNSAVAGLNDFWEVDLWGRVRRLNESAKAQFLASEEARRGVELLERRPDVRQAEQLLRSANAQVSNL
jgi:outer membrane protein, multidrug efflux system